MRISAATAALLVGVEAVADTEPAGENLSKLSRRHLLFQKHRLFQPKVRLDLRNDEPDDDNTKHRKKSKMGDNWLELDEVTETKTTDVETTEASGDAKEEEPTLSEYVVATDETWGQVKESENGSETTWHSADEEDCTEQMRRHLSKQDKAGKDSKVKITTSTWHASTEEAQAESKTGKASKGGKRVKGKGGKESKSSTIKCKPSDKPTVKPSQELPSGTSSPTSNLTPKPTEATTTPPPSTFNVVTESPVAADKTESPTSSDVTAPPSPAKTTESPTGSPSSSSVATESPVPTVTTESPTRSPSSSSVATESPVATVTTESPTRSPSTSSVATESPVATVTTESPTRSPSTSSVATESPVATVTTESPTRSPSTSSVATESPVATVTTESPTRSPSTSSVATESPTSPELTESPSSSGPDASGLTSIPPTANPISSTVTEAPVSTDAPSASPVTSPEVITEAPVIAITTNAPSATVTTESPVASAETCTFCEGGIPDPELVPPGTGGQTCAEVNESAGDYTNGSELCDAIQSVESLCCPEPTDVCAFCEGGIPDPELVPPGTGGQTCAQIVELAAGDTEGTAACTAVQDTEIFCCPEQPTDVCAFCEGGIPVPDLVPPGTGGQTCAQIAVLAAGDTEGTAACTAVQETESFCCSESAGVCTFCEGGIIDQDLVAPDTDGKTCAQIVELAAGETEGGTVCTAIQQTESTCCPSQVTEAPAIASVSTKAPSASPVTSPEVVTGAPVISQCTPFDPNPWTFEPPNNVFPKAPWSTGGDGVWAIDDSNSQEGTYSIKSPILETSEGSAFSNATLAICDDFNGGVLNFNTLAPVIPPYDVLVWYVDGVEISRLAGSPEWRIISIPLSPGAHQIDFQYQYNPFDLPELPPDPPTVREGSVWIDAVELIG